MALPTDYKIVACMPEVKKTFTCTQPWIMLNLEEAEARIIKHQKNQKSLYYIETYVKILKFHNKMDIILLDITLVLYVEHPPSSLSSAV